MLQETEAPAGMQGIKEGSAPNKLQTTERAKHPLQGRQQHVALVRALPRSFLPHGSVVTMVICAHAPEEPSEGEILAVCSPHFPSLLVVETQTSCKGRALLF